MKQYNIYSILTYSRDLGDFKFDLKQLSYNGLKAIRLIYKGLSQSHFFNRLEEIQNYITSNNIELDVIIDLPGNKPIVGSIPNGLNLLAGNIYNITSYEYASKENEIPTINFFQHNEFHKIAINEIISIADDELNLKVLEISKDFIVCEALNTYKLKSNRSISLKNHPFEIEANSARDIQMVREIPNPKSNVKLLVSFTRSEKDVLMLKNIHPTLDIIPKIEDVLEEVTLIKIMQHCNMLMLGRGDLSTTYKPNLLFDFQKKLIQICKSNNKTLILATGILNGIGDKLYPSIAEIMDYSYLRHQGIDAFLITGANANIRPFETLEFMKNFNN